MALLALSFFLLFAFPSASLAENREPVLRDVIFDDGNPDASVGIFKDSLVEAGDLYEGWRVITFRPDAVVLQDGQTEDTFQWLKRGDASAALRRKALRLFIAKQMKAIYEAQVRYFHKFGEGYAPDLFVLIRQELLDGGFRENEKQGYHFEIVEVGHKKGEAFGPKEEPSFKAVARPEVPGMDYFSVDELGEVRFGPTETLALWGPVWDYSDQGGPPPNRYIGLEPQ